MGRKGCIHAVEYAGLQKPYLTAAAFLGRSSNYHGGSGQVLSVRLQPQGSAHRAHRNEIVSAAMPNLGQRIVFRENGNRRAFTRAAGDGGTERLFQTTDTALHLKVATLQEPGKGAG